MVNCILATVLAVSGDLLLEIGTVVISAILSLDDE
jgi:hypothetical protein